MSKSVLLDQLVEHTNYVSVVPQGEASWGLDAGGTHESMQVQESSQAPKDPAPLGVLEGLWEIFISKKSKKMLKRLRELLGIKRRRA